MKNQRMHFLYKRAFFQKGQTLIEVLVALTAATVIIAAIVTASLNSLNNSEYSRDQGAATQYTQQGMEIIRSMRNIDIASLSAQYLPDSTYCLAKTCTSLTPSNSSCWQKNTNCGQNVDKFVREVTILRAQTDCNTSPTPIGSPGVFASNVKVIVKTAWFDPKCTDSTNPFCHSVVQSSCFSDFTIIPTP